MSNVFRYNNCAIFVSSGDSLSDQFSNSGVKQISRVQEFSISVQTPQEEFTYLDGGLSQTMIDHSRVDIGFDYIATNGSNERNIGFITNGLTGALLALNSDKNYYVAFSDGFDAVSDPSTSKTILGLGQAVLNSYSISANVGSFVVASANFTALQMQTYTGFSGQNLPIVNLQTFESLTGANYIFNIPQPTEQRDTLSSNPADGIVALTSNDVMMEFPTGSVFATYLSGSNSCFLQGFNFTMNFERNEIKPLGYVCPVQRPISYPVSFSLQVDALMNKYKIDQLNRLRCPDSGHDINVIIKRPCSDEIALELKLKKMRLVNQNINQNIGSPETVSFEWRGLISNPMDTGNGFFLKSSDGTEFYELDYCIDISGYDEFGVLYFDQECFYNRRILESVFVFNNG